MNYSVNKYENAKFITKTNYENNALRNSSNCYGYTDAIIDNNFNLIYYSVYYSTYDYNKYNNDIKNMYFNKDCLNNKFFINENCLMITTWFRSYGHLMDSLTIIYDFYIKYRLYDSNYKIIISIPPNETNVLEVARILFGDNIINLFSYEDIYSFIEFKHLLLISNHVEFSYFLSYPDSAANKLIENFNDPNIISYENVFISRPHNINPNSRLLKNLPELEVFFRNNNFKIIVPDMMNIKTLYNIIKNSKNIIITNGSALSNLFIMNKNTKYFV